MLDKDHSNRTTILSLGGKYFDPELDQFQFSVLARIHPDNPEQIEKAIEWLSDCCRIQGADTHARNLAIPIIKAIFNELEQLFKDKRPTLVILEEAWLYLRHQLFCSKLTDWFKTLRKLNVSVIFISQDLDDIVEIN